MADVEIGRSATEVARFTLRPRISGNEPCVGPSCEREAIHDDTTRTGHGNGVPTAGREPRRPDPSFRLRAPGMFTGAVSAMVRAKAMPGAARVWVVRARARGRPPCPYPLRPGGADPHGRLARVRRTSRAGRRRSPAKRGRRGWVRASSRSRSGRTCGRWPAHRPSRCRTRARPWLILAAHPNSRRPAWACSSFRRFSDIPLAVPLQTRGVRNLQLPGQVLGHRSAREPRSPRRHARSPQG